MEERYSIREIARLTGLTTATLRKWEERYEVVQPIRLPNGYREYRPEDLAALLWVKEKVDGGALVSTAAGELKERRQAGWQPSLELIREEERTQATVLETWRQALLDALLRRDPPGVTAALDGAFGSFGLETVLIDLIQAVFYEIGHRWESGAISEYQEHFSTVLLRDRLVALRSLVGSRTGPTLVTACLPGEQHEIGALIFGLMAARHGFQWTHLGYSPSPDGLRRALDELKPQVFGLSGSLSQRVQENEAWLRHLATEARQAAPDCLLVVGGHGVRTRLTTPEGVELIPGDARQALDEIDRLLQRS